MNPSNSCGPFKGSSEEHFYTGLVYGLISVSTLNPPLPLRLSYPILYWAGVGLSHRTEHHSLPWADLCSDGLHSRWGHQTSRTEKSHVLIIVVLLVTYFTHLRYAALAQYNSRIKHQLRSVSEETKTLKRKIDTHLTEGVRGRHSW